MPTDAESLDRAALARQVLQRALDDLRREAGASGRSELFQVLWPVLNQEQTDDTLAAIANWSRAELLLALQRLRERLRERVNARLREAEPDPLQRRRLRRQLHQSLRSTEASS